MRKETPSTAVRSPYRRRRSSTTRTWSGDASAEGRRRSGAGFVVTGHRHHRRGASSWHGRPPGREDLLLISGDIGRRLVGTPQTRVRPQRLASVVGTFAGGARAPRMSGVSGSGILDPGEPTTPMTHREVERKVRVPEDFALPPLGGIAPGVTDIVAGEPFTMVAAYHDTHDLRLIRWGATLRRREGGPDEGWHLKLPVADGESLVRDEIALPLDAGDVGHVPSEIADLIRAVVREAPLVHVVTVRTRRAPYVLLDGTGVPVAELVDDRVDVVEDGVVVRSFREIEVEARRDPSRSTTTVLDAVAAALVASGGTLGTRSKAAEAVGARCGRAPDVIVPPGPWRGATAGPAGLRPPDARRGAHPAQRVAHLRPTRRRRVVDDIARGAAMGSRRPGDPPRHRGAPRPSGDACRPATPGGSRARRPRDRRVVA